MSKFEILGNWLMKHAKIVMPVVLAVCVIVTVVISVNANKRDTEQEDVTANSTLEEMAEGIKVTEMPLKENDIPEIEELINKYYTAQADGDGDVIRNLIKDIDDTAIMRIEEFSKYIESYPPKDIYYKPGPEEDTYIVYVCSEVNLIDYDTPIPGLTAHYVCRDEDGNYYFSRSVETDEDLLNYVREVNLQDDVVDLYNKINATYNNMVAEDIDLAQLLLDISEEIDKNIGQALAQAEEDSGTGTGENADASSETEETQDSETVTVVTKVKATDVVNIRSSDSETADKLGKAALGDEFDLIEKIENGWSKVSYNGGEAYIKSEYLEDVETTEVAAGNTDGNGGTANAGGNANNSQSNNDMTTTGTVTVKESVRIRSGASENSEKLATAYTGDKLEVIMKQADGWTKIKYNGGVAYVKSDYVE